MKKILKICLLVIVCVMLTGCAFNNKISQKADVTDAMTSVVPGK